MYVNMNKYILIFCASILVAFYGCMDDDSKAHGQLEVKINFQDDFKNTNLVNIDVLITNRTTGRKYAEKTDNNGLAKFSVEEGIYNVSSVYNMNADTVFNGNLADIIVTVANEEEQVVVDMISVSYTHLRAHET